jgi:hypothetical protein
MSVMFRGKPACTCLASWLPVYEAVLLRRGVIKKSLDIYQLIGTAPASAGTHKGGAYDIAQVSTAAVRNAREMGSAAWHRTPAQGFRPEHHHGVLKGCPHVAPIAANQITALAAGYNGLGHLGRGGKDDGPAPRHLRTWEEGIAWARAHVFPTPPGRDIYHDKHYAKANSTAGDKIAAKKRLWADRDVQRCRGANILVPVEIITHWGKPAAEKFALPSGRVPRRRFQFLPWTIVKTLTAPGGYRIRTAAQALKDAKADGIPGVELELKYLPTSAALRRLAKAARVAYGKDWAKHVEVKILTQFSWQKALKRAKAAGFTTILIGFSGDPMTLPVYVDHYRRP